MPTKIFVTELVNAFNLNNYFSDNIYTNFTVQDGAKGKNDKIVSLFGCDGNIKKYLKEVREKITRRHYSNEEAAGGFYNLSSFPFVFNVGFNKKGKFISKNVKVVELANLMDSEVIRNLKLHFANEFQEAVEAGVTGELKTMGMTADEALKCVRKSVQLERVDELSPYLYCISFGDGYFKEIGHPNPSRFLELFRNVYVAKFNLRLERCGLNNSSIFYEQRDNKLYIKDITDINVINDIVRYVKEEIALDFKTPGDVDSKVENCKDAINDLIFTVTGKFIEGYEYDVFTNKGKIKSGHSFALIPLVEVNGQVVPLSEEDAYKVNKEFYEILGDVVFSNIKGETKDELGQISSSQGPVYAFSNKQIALLLPIIMESPIAYNQINGRFEFAVDLTNFKRRGSSRSSSTVTSPTHAGSSGLETPPNSRKRNRDSGLGDSPPRPEDSVAHSSSSDPRSSFEEIQEPQSCFPRQGALLYHNVGAAEVGAAKNVPAGTSAWSQPMDPWSSSASSAGLSLCQPSRPSSWKGASESGSAWTSQPIGFWSSSALSAEPSLCSQSGPSSSRGASESMRIGRSTWYVSSSGVEDVNDVEHEKQQVSDGCSEAKSQDSKSPKKHGGGLLCKERWSTLTKFSPFKRRSVERDTMCSSKSDLVHHVTKKPPLSERSASARKAKSNPPSGVTSPTHEGAPGGLKPLTSDERKELRPFLPPELRKKLDSHSFLPGKEQHLYLTHTLSGKRELSRSLCEGEQSQLLRLTKAQLPDNSSSKKVDRDSGFCSMGSPAVLHKGSVSSELKHPQQVKHMSEALGK